MDLRVAVQKLRKFWQAQRRAPSVEEVRRLLGYRSKSTAHWFIRKLEKKGCVRKGARGRLLFDGLGGIRLLGTVQAGFPHPAEEELADTLSLDQYLIRRPEQSFLIKVTGDSMTGAGIREGDLVVVERGRAPENRDIVIAQVDGEWTMKYYEKTGKEVRLVAANPKYSPIRPKQELVLGGVVVAVIRKMK